MTSYKTFLQLHQNEDPLLIANIWDVNSAKVFERNGYKAVATSSSAVANTFGYDDGENLPFETLLQVAKRTVEVVKVPVSIDLEGGFSRMAVGITENIKKLHDVGVVGINFEDSLPGKTRQMQSVEDFQKLLSTVANQLAQCSIKIYLNIRTDGFLLGMPTALSESLTRIKSYETSGASGIFVPCIVEKNDIKEVVNATRLPVNVMCMPNLPDFNELKSLGVKRISMGPFVHVHLNKTLEEISKAILMGKSFSSLFQ